MLNILRLVVLILLIILLLYKLCGAEGLMPYYLDQISMKNPDPIKFHYDGRKRDVLGLSGRDYYLENDLMYRITGQGEKYGSDLFKNNTNYARMPIKYRPKDISHIRLPKIEQEKYLKKQLHGF